LYQYLISRARLIQCKLKPLKVISLDSGGYLLQEM
jgi:hypothetical protein